MIVRLYWAATMRAMAKCLKDHRRTLRCAFPDGDVANGGPRHPLEPEACQYMGHVDSHGRDG